MRKRAVGLISLLLICSILLGACGLPFAAAKNLSGETEAASQASPSASSVDQDPADIRPSSAVTVSPNVSEKPTPAAEKEQTPEPTAAAPSAASPTPKAASPSTPAVSSSPTPAATAAPEPPGSLDALEAQLKAALESYDGTWSVYCKRLDTDESFCINDSPMVSASLIKLYVFGAVMESVRNGELSYEDCAEPLELMLQYSDNDSCNYLIDAAGGLDTINFFILRRGFKDTCIARHMLEKSDLENYTSTKDCGELLEEILDGIYVSKETSELMLNYLLNQYTRCKIPAGVPEGIEVANKTGELDNAENDAAIVFSPACTYILCVMSNDLEPYFNNDGISQICEISKTVYNYLNN